MIRKNIVTLFMMIALVAIPLIAHAQEPPLSQVAKGYEEEILRCSARGEYRKAILAAAKYEQELLSRYKPPTYEMGLLQSKAEHVSFHSPFNMWKQMKIDELGLPKELSMMGSTVLLALNGNSQEEGLLVFCVNMKRFGHRMGLSDVDQMFSSDQGLRLLAQMMSGLFGMVRSQQFQMIGDHRVLFSEIVPAMLGPEIRMIMLPHDGRIFVFLLTSPAGDIATNEKRLCDLVKTVSFTYKTENQDAIDSERAKFDPKDVKSLLKCIKSLATLGEYNAAAEDLSRLRILLHSHMPKATLKGDIAYCPGYGIELKNPDPSKWRLSIQKDGVFEGVLLEDKYSVNGEGIMVGVVDLVMAYGQVAIQMVNDEETSKQLLVDGGRGSAMSLGEIESERFTTIKGNFAYEAIVRPNIPMMKARCQWIMRPESYGIMIVMLGDGRNFQTKIADCDIIIDNCLGFSKIP